MTIILGIEGTAWNLSAALVNEEEVIVEATRTYTPVSGGIHPREAAQHHAAHVGEVTEELFRRFEEKGYSKTDIDAVAFSKGPGLGPCLRIVATAARMISLMLEKPLIGVNHCVAHIEIGLWKTEATDPITLYVSGANSQVLAYEEFEPGIGAYRVFGETLDIGLGNSLDKFARSAGLSHPGGPQVEKLAENATDYIDLPYTVKGMDFFFSGLSTAATRLLKNNKAKDGKTDEKILANACYSYQETAFAMAVEVTERALAHTGKTEVLLAGGVGANSRLREMLARMCADRGAKFFVPEKKFMGDNGAMIARTGLLMYLAGETLPLNVSYVDAGFRPDEVRVSWKSPQETDSEKERKKMQNGAEAVVNKTPKSYGFEEEFGCFEDNIGEMIVKERLPKNYRLPQIDAKLRKERTRTEVRMMTEARRCGIAVPVLYGAEDFVVKMEYIRGTPLKFVLDAHPEQALKIGEAVGRLHTHHIIHGDLTTSNMIAGEDEKLYLIDFGLSFSENSLESKGVDLHVLFQTFESSHKNPQHLKELFVRGYKTNMENADAVLKRAEEIKQRGRYIEGK